MAGMNKRPDDEASKAGPVRPGAAPAYPLLRRQAEELALKTAALSRENEKAMSPETTRLMLHELHVHQIELEMQNEELRRTQLELEASRARYFDLYDLAPVGYCSVSEHGIILQANLAAASLLGLSRGALTMQPISGVVFTADQDVYYLCRKQLFDSGEAQACELRMVKSDGTPFWVQLAVTIARGAEGAEAAAVMRVVLNDINERKLMEAAMRASEERYRAMVEGSPEAITVQRAGNIIYANAAALKLFGTTHAHHLTGKPVLDRVHPDFHPLVHTRMKALTSDKVAAPMAGIVMLRLDGTPIEVEVQSIRTVFNGVPVIQSTLHDVTERVRLGRLLQARNGELEIARSAADQANAAKSEFLSRMSHELRTPLSTMLGFAQLMDSGTPAPSPSQKRSIDQILQAGWYLLELINEVLDLALVESGKLALALEPVRLAEILIECHSMVETQAQKRTIDLSFPPTTLAHFVQADRTRIKQVLINLLSNAIKYNKQGGTVVVDCVVTDPDHLRIAVQDTGAGLTPDQLAQLFQPFNRLGQQANATEGTGIGLVLSKRLVEAMGGLIGVESRPGQGSVFWIDLNRAAQPHASAVTSGPMASDRAATKSGLP